MENAGRDELFGEGQEGQKARWLAYGLSTVVLFCLLAALSLALLEPPSSRRALAYALMPPPALVALYLVHRGRLALASRVAAWGLWLALVLAVALNRGLQEPLALAFPILILAAGLVLDMAAVWLLTALTLAVALFLLLAQQHGMLPALPPPPPAWQFLRVVLASLAAAILATRLITQLRKRMAALRLEGDSLSRRLGEMAAREGLLNLVMENVPALIHYADRDFRCLFANRPFRQFFALPEAPAQARGLEDLIGREALAALRPHAQGALGGQPATARLRLPSRSGEVRSFDCTFLPDRDYAGQVRGYFGQMVDVTGAEAVRAELHRSEEKFARVFDAAPIPIALLGVEDGRMLEVNDALCRASGWQREQILGRTTLEMGFWPSAADRDAWKQKLFRDGHVRNQELRLVVASGQPRWALVSSELISLPDGPAILSFIVDVTERKRTEEAMAQANIRLEQGVKQRTNELEAANRELESFAYSVSHDLRAPLRSIDGFSHILLSDYGERLDSEGRAHLQRIRRSAQRLGNLIDDLLELSRVSRQEMLQEEVDLCRLAREVLDELARDDKHRPADIRCCAACPREGKCGARGDPVLLRSLLENLLGNAWKYTGHGDHPLIEFGCREEGGRREFFVRDNGVGFDMAHAKKLFQPFQRLHHASQFEGTGIGLATAARIVRRHGGEIRAESAPGQGATFSFTLA